jgi:MoaA/NifB/PqqE/SkfB family radical SAM enzyme
LRISVTDRCNLRCIYCMPPEGVPWHPHEEILRYQEIETIVRAAAELGISKIRLTGASGGSTSAWTPSARSVSGASRAWAGWRMS